MGTLTAVPERIRSKFDVDPSGCWVWNATRDRGGYGLVHFKGRNRIAHRVVYSLMVRQAPQHMELDHLCHTRACVNPDHLREVTHKQNLENRRGAQRTNPTGVRGVQRRSNGRFSARAKHNGVDYHAGTFATVEEAAEAATALRARLFTAASP